MKFLVPNFDGTPRHFFTVTETVEATNPLLPEPTPSHHIVIVDASGSMYYDLPAVREKVAQIAALTEFTHSRMLFSVISYASNGDVVTHLNRVPASDLSKPGTDHIAKINAIRTRGLTCISQSLTVAESLIREGETTAISLHSDGYANDSSPSAEARAIEAIVARIAARGSVFINTVAYNNYSDFSMLSRIANSCSGSCAQVTSASDLHRRLLDTTRLLASGVSPVEVSEIRDADYQVFWTGDRILGSNTDLRIRGLGPEDARVVYHYTRVSRDAYLDANVPVISHDTGTTLNPILALARAYISEGRLADAKRVILATGDVGLTEDAIRASTASQVAALAVRIEKAMDADYTAEYIPYAPYTGATVLQILSTLSANKNDLLLNLSDLVGRYTRRTVRRVPGTRNDAGEIVPPDFKLVSEKPDWVQMPGMEFNTSSATINALTVIPAQLVGLDGKRVSQVEGILLDDLKAYNNYTIVSDGDVCVDSLEIRASTPRVFNTLKNLGLVSGDFHTGSIRINLTDYPITSLDSGALHPVNPDEVFRVKTLLGILRAAGSAKAPATYSEKQVEALKAHCLSPALYYSAPTTTSYANLDDAIAKGEVDYRVSYSVDIGSTSILSADALYSANKFFDRTYTVTHPTGLVSDPKITDTLMEKAIIDTKVQGPRVKVTAVDALQKEVFDAVFLGNDPNHTVRKTLGALCFTLDEYRAAIKVNNPSLVASLEGYIERNTDYDLVFFVGSTGLVPEEYGDPITADELKAKFPNIVGLGKKQSDGFFYLGPNNTVLSVYAESVAFTK